MQMMKFPENKDFLKKEHFRVTLPTQATNQRQSGAGLAKKNSGIHNSARSTGLRLLLNLLKAAVIREEEENLIPQTLKRQHGDHHQHSAGTGTQWALSSFSLLGELQASARRN